MKGWDQTPEEQALALDAESAQLTDQALREYINAHPNATPQEILAHFGVPFDRGLYEAVLALNPDTVAKLRTSPNPNDRAWTDKPQ